MTHRRYELALQLLGPSDWRRFEEFGGTVLAGEFAGYRPTAAPAGDRGRDGELYAGPDPKVLFQLSVAGDWRQKIRSTARRIAQEFPSAIVLVYVTNQRIGADWDELRSEIRRDHGLFLDVRDRDWILGRLSAGSAVEAEAERLAVAIVDPYLADGATTRHAAVLTRNESRAALTYLELRWADDTREKGLTRLAFEGVVRAVLRDTDTEHRLPRAEVHSRVRALLPSHDGEAVDRFSDAALGRMTRGAVRHWRSRDEFCLSYEERVRLSEGLARLEIEERDLRDAVCARVSALLGQTADPADVDEMAAHARRVLDKFLLDRGEAFAQSVTSGNLRELDLSAVRDFVLADMSEHPHARTKDRDPRFVEQLVQSLLVEPDENIHEYLGRLSCSYTLFAFLHETPDVQSAVTKMFGTGEIWLDSSVILPLLADTLEGDEHRHFTALVRAAREAGIELWTTPGAIEEVERHLNRVLVCARTPADVWRGEYPYLYGAYVQSGRDVHRISMWIETFVGSRRREEDLALYLSDAQGIRTRPFDGVETADPELWMCALNEWQRLQEGRRGSRPGNDPMLTLKLARHDAESYVGILGMRRRQSATALGYATWWLTLDRGAWGVHERVARQLQRRDFYAPLMSPDFLRSYLSFGPLRRLVPRALEADMPVVADLQLSQYVPRELVELANAVRADCRGLPEAVIRRRVRDQLDSARTRQGPLALGGLRELRERLKAAD